MVNHGDTGWATGTRGILPSEKGGEEEKAEIGRMAPGSQGTTAPWDHMGPRMDHWWTPDG